MIIIIDTREQVPLRFSPEIPTRVATLDTGDYSIAGLEDQIVIERKSLSDLLGTITAGRDTFVRELRRMRKARFAAVVIEADWSTILMKQYPQAVHQNAVIGSLMAFAIKYGVVPIMASDHATAGDLVERLLINYMGMFERDYREIKKLTEALRVTPEAAE